MLPDMIAELKEFVCTDEMPIYGVGLRSVVRCERFFWSSSQRFQRGQRIRVWVSMIRTNDRIMIGCMRYHS